MTKARSRGKIRPDNNPQPPAQGTKGWIRVIARGCGGYKTPDTPDSSGEYDCRHDYGWTCDDCPVCIESQMDREAEWVHDLLTVQGPPREFKHPGEFWMYPAVATELYWSMSDDEIKAATQRFGVVGRSIPDSTFGNLL